MSAKKRNTVLATVRRVGPVIVAIAAVFVACEKPSKPEPEPEADERVFGVRVQRSSGDPVTGARVRIPLDGRVFARETDNDGECRFHIPDDVSLPGRVIATIDHSSIMPEAVAFSGDPGTEETRSRTCLPAPSRTYARDVDLHHLGNDRYDGEANSQLQLRSEGVSRSYTFHLDTYPGRMPMLRLYARGVQHPTEIIVNGEIINRLDDSNPEGGLSRYQFRLSGSPRSVLRPGGNTFTIKTAPYEEWDPWDDIEFCSMILYFE